PVEAHRRATCRRLVQPSHASPCSRRGVAHGRIPGSRTARRLTVLTHSRSIMPSFTHGPVKLDYLDSGDGDPIVLVHGFASTKEVNWVYPGWVTVLMRAGRRVI